MPRIDINMGGDATQVAAAIRSQINALIGEVQGLRTALGATATQFTQIATTLKSLTGTGLENLVRDTTNVATNARAASASMAELRTRVAETNTALAAEDLAVSSLVRNITSLAAIKDLAAKSTAFTLVPQTRAAAVAEEQRAALTRNLLLAGSPVQQQLTYNPAIELTQSQVMSQKAIKEADLYINAYSTAIAASVAQKHPLEEIYDNLQAAPRITERARQAATLYMQSYNSEALQAASGKNVLEDALTSGVGAPKLTTNVRSYLASYNGDALQAASSAKTLENALASGVKEFQNGETAIKGFDEVLREVSKGFQLVLGPLSGVASRITAFAGLSGANAGLAAAVVTIAALGVTLYETISKADAFEAELFKLQGILKVTGDASGLTLGQLNDYARGLGRATLSSASELREAEGVLLTFTGLTGDQFKQTLSLANDLARIGFGGLSEEARLLGKALQNPVDNLQALTRQLGKIDPETTRRIQEQAIGGDVTGARQQILNLVQGRAGGAATAEAQGLAGAFHVMAQNSREFFETVGTKGGVVNTLEQQIRRLTESMTATDEQFNLVGKTAKILNVVLDISFGTIHALGEGVHVTGVILGDLRIALSQLSTLPGFGALALLIKYLHEITAVRDPLNDVFKSTTFSVGPASDARAALAERVADTKELLSVAQRSGSASDIALITENYNDANKALQQYDESLKALKGDDAFASLASGIKLYLPQLEQLADQHTKIVTLNRVLADSAEVAAKLHIPEDFVRGLAEIDLTKIADQNETLRRQILLNRDSTEQVIDKARDEIKVHQLQSQVLRAEVEDRIALTAQIKTQQEQVAGHLRPTIGAPLIGQRTGPFGFDATGGNAVTAEASAIEAKNLALGYATASDKAYDLVQAQGDSVTLLKLQSENIFTAVDDVNVLIAKEKERQNLDKVTNGLTIEQKNQLVENAGALAHLNDLVAQQAKAWSDVKGEAGKLFDSFNKFLDSFGQKTKGGIKAQLGELTKDLGTDLEKSAFDFAVKNPILNRLGGAHQTDLRDVLNLFNGQSQQNIKDASLQVITDNTSSLDKLTYTIDTLTQQMQTSTSGVTGGTGPFGFDATGLSGGSAATASGPFGFDATGLSSPAGTPASGSFLSGIFSHLFGGSLSGSSGGLFGLGSGATLGIGGAVGGGLGALFGQLFGGSKGAGIGGALGSVAGILASLLFLDKGDTFQHGRITPFAYGTVVNTPHVFPMADGGFGMFGEDGPEAAMPLIRTRTGHLGVRAMAGFDRSYATAPRVVSAPSIHLDNNSNTRLRHESTAQYDNAGNLSQIKIALYQVLDEDMDTNGKFSRGLQKRFNLDRRNDTRSRTS